MIFSDLNVRLKHIYVDNYIRLYFDVINISYFHISSCHSWSKFDKTNHDLQRVHKTVLNVVENGRNITNTLCTTSAGM